MSQIRWLAAIIVVPFLMGCETQRVRALSDIPADSLLVVTVSSPGAMLTVCDKAPAVKEMIDGFVQMGASAFEKDPVAVRAQVAKMGRVDKVLLGVREEPPGDISFARVDLGEAGEFRRWLVDYLQVGRAKPVETIAGVDVYRAPDAGAGAAAIATYAFKGNVLLIADSVDTMRSVLTLKPKASLAHSRPYADAMKQLPADVFLSAWVNVSSAAPMLAKADFPGTSTLMKVIDPKTIASATAFLSAPGDRLLIQIDVRLNEDDPAYEAIRTPPCAHRGLQFIPSDAHSAMAMSIEDGARKWRQLLPLIEICSPGFTTALKKSEEDYGFSVEQMAGTLTDLTWANGVQRVTVMGSSRPEVLMEGIRRQAAAGERTTTKEIEGVSALLNSEGHAVVRVGDFVLMSSSAEAMRASLKARNDRKSLFDAESVRATLPLLYRPNSKIIVFDAAIMGFVPSHPGGPPKYVVITTLEEARHASIRADITAPGMSILLPLSYVALY